MSYEPTTWKSGDVVTSTKLNKMEQGIANAGGGGGMLVVRWNEGMTALDTKWSDIAAAISNKLVILLNDTGAPNEINISYCDGVEVNQGAYNVYFFHTGGSDEFSADSADGYPVPQ